MVSSEIFSCTDCVKTFNTRGKFNQHQRTHTKPFVCKTCNKGFALRADLSRHSIARHRVGNIRVPCTVAGCRFVVSRKDNITKHMKRFHPIEFRERKQRKLDTAKHKDTNVLALDHLSEPETQTVFNWWHAAGSGHTAALDSLLSRGFNINSKAGDGNTALHCAAFAGQVAVVEYLLERGAQLNLKNNKHETALFEAAAGASPEIVLTLMKAGSTVTYFFPRYVTPQKCFVDHIVQIGDVHLVEAIIKMDTPQIETRPASKAYAFAVAAAKIGQLTILQSILNSDPSAFRKQRDNLRPPVYYAFRTGNTAAVNMLLELELKERDKESGRVYLASLFDPAVRSGCLEILKMLLELSPQSIGRLDRSDRSLLHIAASKGHLDCVLFLLSHNHFVDCTNAKDRNQDTALCLAARHGHLHIVQTLLDYFDGLKSSESLSGYAPLLAAFWNNKLDVVHVLLKHRPMNLEAGGVETQGSALASVARSLLLNDVINIDSLSDDQYRRSLLHLAVRFSDLELAELVLTHTDWNLLEQCKRPPWNHNHPQAVLRFARERGLSEMVELLQAHGITDPDEADHYQQLLANQASLAPTIREQSIPTQDDQELGYDSDLEEQPYSYVDEYISPHSNEDSDLMPDVEPDATQGTATRMDTVLS